MFSCCVGQLIQSSYHRTALIIQSYRPKPQAPLNNIMMPYDCRIAVNSSSSSSFEVHIGQDACSEIIFITSIMYVQTVLLYQTCSVSQSNSWMHWLSQHTRSLLPYINLIWSTMNKTTRYAARRYYVKFEPHNATLSAYYFYGQGIHSFCSKFTTLLYVMDIACDNNEHIFLFVFIIIIMTK